MDGMFYTSIKSHYYLLYCILLIIFMIYKHLRSLRTQIYFLKKKGRKNLKNGRSIKNLRDKALFFVAEV